MDYKQNKSRKKIVEDGNPKFRNRIKEIRLVKASDIIGAPWNWRSHPESQKDQIVASIEELGFFDPLDTRELPDGSLQLFDGHARTDLINSRIGPDTLVPCVVTDLTEEEAKKAILLKDPISAEATIDKEKLDALLAEVETQSKPIKDLLDKLAKQAATDPAGQSTEPSGAGTEIKARFDILLECESEQQQAALLERLTADGFKCRSLIA